MSKLGIIFTTFLREKLAKSTIQSVLINMPKNAILFIGDQGNISQEMETFYQTLDKDKVQVYRLPFDCGLSYARNYLVKMAQIHKCEYCVISADSIRFDTTYSFNEAIEFLNAEETRALLGFSLKGRINWEYDMKLIPGRHFRLSKPKRLPIIYKGMNIQPIDICKNFFIAKTQALLDVGWDENLKLCVEANQPVITKNCRGQIKHVPIKSLFPSSVLSNTYSFHHNGPQVWTETGWQHIKKISRNKIKKDILQIQSSHGYIETTPDHVFMVNNRQKIASDFKLKDTFNMYPYPELTNLLEVNSDWAWLLGFFLAEGTCKSNRGDRIEITNQNYETLKKCEKIFNSIGVMCAWYPKDLNRNRKDKCLFLRVKTPRALSSYFQKFYIRGEKNIPYFIYDFNKEARQNFINGFLEGDGIKQTGTVPLILCQKSPSIINGILHIGQDLYKNHRIMHQSNKLGRWFKLSLKNSHYRNRNVSQIHTIINKTTNDYVYDIECDTHHFCAGIGNILVHNCEHEDFFENLKLRGYKAFYTNYISATYIKDKTPEYNEYRRRLYNTYIKLLRKKYSIQGWTIIEG